MFYLYILLSETKKRTYTGITDDVERRLAQHNAGKIKSSSPFRPYTVIHVEAFAAKGGAFRRETYYKTGGGRRRIKKMFFNP